jgi:phosphate-selective porin OprO/OprP
MSSTANGPASGWVGDSPFDYGAFKQDAGSEEQFTLDERGQAARFQVPAEGRLKFFGQRKVTYTAGIMYDGGAEEWVMRQTGIMVELPKNGGNLFFGRTKEGFSMSKIMVGYEILGLSACR